MPNLSKMRADLPNWSPVIAREFNINTNIIGHYLQNEIGYKKGDTLVILARSSYWTLLLEFACLKYGIIVCPLYETASRAQIIAAMRQVGSEYVFLDSERHLHNIPLNAKILREQDLMEAVGHYKTQVENKPDMTSEITLPTPPEILPTDTALIMLSASMEKSKVGVRYTHQEVLDNVVAVSNRILNSSIDMSTYLSFLSLANIAPKIFLYTAFYLKSKIGVSFGVKRIMEDMQTFNPTFVVCVPRVFDRIYSSIFEDRVNDGFLSTLGFDYLNRKYKQLLVHRIMRRKPSERLKKKLLLRIGGKLTVAMSTALKADRKLLKFFNNIGIATCDCYSITEFKGIISFSTPESASSESTGVPLDMFDVGVIDDNIYINGVSTHDIGHFDDNGELIIGGRDSDVIILSTGEKIIPDLIQQAIATETIIEDVLVIGERRPYISALVALDNEFLEKELEDAGIDSNSIEASVYIDRHVGHIIDRVNKTLSDSEQIKRYLIIEDGFIASGMVTGSLRLKRDALCKHYKDQINNVLYS